jgi:NOL1/NOP2/fmu family ribosome biogenesis protein
MAKIYIVLTQTGSILSNLIKCYSGKEYNHVSISLDEELNELYSFGRTHPYNAFSGGFVHEGINIGTFKRFKGTKAVVYALEVTKQQYCNIANQIYRMSSNKKKYKFNRTGLFLASIHKIRSVPNHFYCSEFAKYLFNNSGIDVSKLPTITHPEDFVNLEKIMHIYTGLLKDYHYPID